MGILKNEYKSFLDDVEKNIKNKEDLEYIKQRFTSFIDIMLDQIDHIMEYKKEKIEKLETAQNQLENKVTMIQSTLENMQKEIEVEEGFDFEIVCPYCDNEFIADIDEKKLEVECPNCKNTIELDWTGDLEESAFRMPRRMLPRWRMPCYSSPN